MAFLINISQGTKLDHTGIQKQACSTHYVSSPHLGQWSTIYKAPDMMKAGKCIVLTICFSILAGSATWRCLSVDDMVKPGITQPFKTVSCFYAVWLCLCS